MRRNSSRHFNLALYWSFLLRCNLFIRFLNKSVIESRLQFSSHWLTAWSTRRFCGNTDVRSQDWQQGNATDHWCLHKTSNALPHIYSLIDLNQTDLSWVLTPAGTFRKPSAYYIIVQRETRLRSWCRPERRAQSKQRLHNQGWRLILKLVVDYSNAKF